jgi:putative oxygen-independent coproporphyrinogen III oxidase
MELPPLGLYIHLPWCERKCPYCDFNSHEIDIIPESRYIDALLRDLREDLPLVQHRTVATLFIGGGTPSLFSAGGIARLLREIAHLVPLAPTLEATLEANPGSAEAGKFAAFCEAGINRLSLGIQSFQDAQLQALGRVHNADQAHAAVDFARAAGFDSFNIDLMHGLPGQSVAAARADLDTALDCAPAHLSWYQLTIEPNTVFHKRPPLLPVEDALAAIQDDGERLLTSRGYGQYEVSAYSQPGFQCRHNLNYWSFGDYLGIGAGAHGKITHADGRIQRYAKKRQPAQYLSSSAGEFRSSSRALDPEEIPGEFMLNALRLNEGFPVSLFEHRTGLDICVIQPQLDQLLERGLLQRTADNIHTTDLGRRFLDSVVGEFFVQ